MESRAHFGAKRCARTARSSGFNRYSGSNPLKTGLHTFQIENCWQQRVIREIRTLGACLSLIVLVTKAVLSAEPVGVPAFLPGLKQSLILANQASENRSDFRVSRLIALYVPEGEFVSPFLEPGPFVSKWEGFLNLKINDDFVFSAKGFGALTVWINGVRVLESKGPNLDSEKSGTIEMKKGANRIEVTYASPEAGASEFRLYWWNPLQPIEPLSPELFTHDAKDPELAAGIQRRAGRRLFGEYRCIRCHKPDRPFGTGAMPELHYDSPGLTGVGDRLEKNWMVDWLLDPRSVRHDARMPRMLNGEPEVQARDAADIAAFLSVQSLGAQSSAEVGSLSEDEHAAEAGKGLFDTLGCFTCHRLPGDAILIGEDRLALDLVRAKWKPRGLVDFLKNPTSHFKWTRMPDFGFTEEEARSLAAFVLSRCGEQTQKNEIGDPERGRALVGSKGCLKCHDLKDSADKYSAPGLAALRSASSSSGCLSYGSRTGGHPNYRLEEEDRNALFAFIRFGLESLWKKVPTEFASRQFKNLRCAACHARDTEQDVWGSLIARNAIDASTRAGGPDGDLIDDFGDDFGDDPVAPDATAAESNIHLLRPPLTWVGEKLHADWMTQFISGKLRYKPRAQLRARMPAFPAFAKDLSAGFVMDHGFSPIRPPNPPIDRGLAQIGEKLIQMDKLGCVSCHAVGEKGALSGPASEAINFKYTPERLRRHYFERFVRDPKRVLPGTMMPQFVDEEGHTPFSDILEGDANRQFDAIWHFMRTLSE